MSGKNCSFFFISDVTYLKVGNSENGEWLSSDGRPLAKVALVSVRVTVRVRTILRELCGCGCSLLFILFYCVTMLLIFLVYVTLRLKVKKSCACTTTH